MRIAGSRYALGLTIALGTSAAHAETPPAPPPSAAPAAPLAAEPAPPLAAEPAPPGPSAAEPAPLSSPAERAPKADGARASEDALPSDRAVVLRAVTTAPPDCASCAPPQRGDLQTERQLATLTHDLDGIVVDALEDLGLRVDPTARNDATATEPSDATLTARARTSWVFSPRVALDRSKVVVRILAVAPGSSVVLSRTETLSPEELEVRTVLMMRDLVRAGSRRATEPVTTPQADEDAVVHAARSHGRAVLALNAAVLGGYVGFSLQRAGGSDDARLTYPLVALGAGIGLGGSMIVADEWDVGIGDAWYLAAGMWWPTIGALLVARDEPERSRYLYGSAAAAGGLSLATLSLVFGPMGEGDALVANSGGAYGLLLGGILDLAVQGQTDGTPTTGMGVGALSGVALTGALARFTRAQPASRILLIDLGAGLGALTGAAVASPLVFGDEVTKTENRLWLSSIALGAFVGAGVGFLTTDSGHDARDRAASPPCLPFVGSVGESIGADGRAVPAPGGGVRGIW